ncbi:hypothetical protein [Cyanobium sp. N5-Cardenillas]|uniref:hypothetical protein n=1 Tax=Cyanobium sp. N5-Cardenillas TaxID=2823720 RepID=UPI0020CFE893|nr:hypothetical protein [Cyanobium sp. N5-Cardenillas]
MLNITLEMSSTINLDTPTGVLRLEKAMRTVLKEAFDDTIRSLAECQTWYSSSIDSSEVFLLWVCDQLLTQNDPQWIFQPLRASERKYLAEEVGINRQSISGKPPEETVEMILKAVGLPPGQIAGTAKLVAKWETFEERIRVGDGQSVASLARQLAERVLRVLLFFYGGKIFPTMLKEMLESPGSLRLPRILQEALTDAEAESQITNALQIDGWADLGFLNLALRKLSARLESQATTLVNANELNILSSKEQETFNCLATALQAYTHDRPSSNAEREAALLSAVTDVKIVLRTMIERGSMPDYGVVIECCDTIFGKSFVVRCETRCRRLLAEVPPGLGEEILFVSSTTRDWARCEWSSTPWAIH